MIFFISRVNNLFVEVDVLFLLHMKTLWKKSKEKYFPYFFFKTEWEKKEEVNFIVQFKFNNQSMMNRLRWYEVKEACRNKMISKWLLSAFLKQRKIIDFQPDLENTSQRRLNGAYIAQQKSTNKCMRPPLIQLDLRQRQVCKYQLCLCRWQLQL